jgi:hypothetical protein
MKLKFFFMVFFLSLFVFAQDKPTVEMIIHKTEKFYEKQSEYAYKTIYKFHKDSSSDMFLDRDEGLIIRKNGVNYQKLHDTESFYFGKQSMVIDRQNRIVYIAKKTKSNQLFSFNIYLKQFNNKKVISYKNFWICELSNPVNNFSQYNKVRFYFFKNDFRLYKQVFFTKGNQTILDNGKKIALKDPRLEIILQESKILPSYSSLLNKSSYYKLIDGRIILNKKIANYKLVAN